MKVPSSFLLLTHVLKNLLSFWLHILLHVVSDILNAVTMLRQCIHHFFQLLILLLLVLTHFLVQTRFGGFLRSLNCSFKGLLSFLNLRSMLGNLIIENGLHAININYNESYLILHFIHVLLFVLLCMVQLRFQFLQIKTCGLDDSQTFYVPYLFYLFGLFRDFFLFHFLSIWNLTQLSC